MAEKNGEGNKGVDGERGRRLKKEREAMKARDCVRQARISLPTFPWRALYTCTPGAYERQVAAGAN